MERPVSEIAFRLDSGEAHDREVVSGVGNVVEKGRFADAGFAANHDGAAGTSACLGEQGFKSIALDLAADQVHGAKD
jgi:hypothetical protein